MMWFWFGIAFLVANASALGFYFALRLRRWGPTVAWLVCCAVVLLSPCLIPLAARPLRFLESVAAVCLVWKLYDAYREPEIAAGMGIGRWMVYLPNWFWFVLRRVPRRRAPGRDWARVTALAPLMVAAVALWLGSLRVDWSRVPFAVEHAVKVCALAVPMMLIGQTAAALYRQLLGPALDPFDNPFAARTPADFWRRWNPAFRDFFDEFIFRPLGGARRPVVATLAVFAVSGVAHEYVFGVATGRVQGWQMLFFMTQGCAAAATLRIRPRGRAVVLWWAGTFVFNLATSVLFCRSVNGVIAFYHR
jgi:hypothetical protein